VDLESTDIAQTGTTSKNRKDREPQMDKFSANLEDVTVRPEDVTVKGPARLS
jgi:hypothetical protein